VAEFNYGEYQHCLPTNNRMCSMWLLYKRWFNGFSNSIFFFICKASVWHLNYIVDQ
jgi:hypothetical protein